MKLHQRPNDGPPVSVRLKLPGGIHRTLASYAQFYRHQHGDPIEIPDLVIEIVRAFVTGDRDFRLWRRNAPAASAGPVTDRSQAKDAA
jgi:hypothetical protein